MARHPRHIEKGAFSLNTVHRHGIRDTLARHPRHLPTASETHGTASETHQARHPRHISHGIRDTFAPVDMCIIVLKINGLQGTPAVV